MSEVKRYMESCGEGGGVVEHRNGDFVSIKDFDRVTAERDAARGREAELRLRLEQSTAAHEVAAQNHGALNTEVFVLQQRADLLEGLLREVVGSCALIFQDHDATAETMDLHERAEAALKPAEVRCNIPACDYQIDMDQN